MDIRPTNTHYEFLNLTDLDDIGKHEINNILKSHPTSDILKLPWDIGENDNYNAEQTNVPEQPKEWHFCEENNEMMKNNNIPAQPNVIFSMVPSPPYYPVQQERNDYYVSHDMNNYHCMQNMQPYQQSMHPLAANDAQFMRNQMSQSNLRFDGRGRGRGRGHKRGGGGSGGVSGGGGGNDNFSNRNHSHNINHNEMPQPTFIATDRFMPFMFPVADMMGNCHDPVTGPPLFTTFSNVMPWQQSTLISSNAVFMQNPKFTRQSSNIMQLPPPNGEVVYNQGYVQRNTTSQKERQDKHYHHSHHTHHQNRNQNQNPRVNNRQPIRQTSEEESSPQTNILNTTIILKNSNLNECTNDEAEEDEVFSRKSTVNGQNPPVNVKIQHSIISTINDNSTKENKTERPMVNINSSIEVKQNGNEKEMVDKTVVTEQVEAKETKVVPKVEEKSSNVKNVVTAVPKIDIPEQNIEEEKQAIPTSSSTISQQQPQSQDKVQSNIKEEIVEKISPTPPSPITETLTMPKSWAMAVKENSTSGNASSTCTVKPTAKINPLNVTPTAENNISDSATQEKNVKRKSVSFNNNNNNNNNDNDKSSNSVLQKENTASTNSNGNHNCNSDAAKSQAKDRYNDPITYRMGEFLHGYQMDKQTVSLLPRGLTNRSNYCYINSILQALLACPPFYNLLMAMPHVKNASRKNSVTPLLDNMIKFVQEFTPLSDGARLSYKKDRSQKRNENAIVDIQSGVPFEPVYVYTMLKNTSSVFSVEGRQEDAEEFLSCLLNGISDEMLELMKIANNDKNITEKVDPNINLNQDGEEWKIMGPKNKGSITRCTEIGKTPLSDIFRGQLRSRVFRAGEQATDYVQPFFTLQLDIEKAESVRGAFEILVGKDPVEGMTCSKTKQEIEAWKQVFLEELPVILILHLKWFDYKLDGCSKILKQVEFPVNLKIDNKFLSSNATKKFSNKQRQYKLFAVTYHDGKEATKGHYLTDAFHVGYGGWVRYDDSSLKGVPEGNVLKPQPPRVPYLLYYRRQDTIGNNNNNCNVIINNNNNNQANTLNVRSR